MIEVKNLSYAVGGNTILQNLNWQVKQGQHALLLGSSGSGKTTLLHILAGLLTPTSGAATVDGKMLAGNLDAWRGRNVGMVFQTLHLVKALTVRDNLRLAQTMAKTPADDARIDSLLQSLGLADKAGSYPHQLSVGQAQRLGVARAVVNKPKWILADEPTSALDDTHCFETLNLLEAQAQECSATLIIATHDQRIKGRFAHRLELSESVRQAA
jgi:putative ABC transport system ATP-binding protein